MRQIIYYINLFVSGGNFNFFLLNLDNQVVK